MTKDINLENLRKEARAFKDERLPPGPAVGTTVNVVDLMVEFAAQQLSKAAQEKLYTQQEVEAMLKEMATDPFRMINEAPVIILSKFLSVANKNGFKVSTYEK